MTNLEDIIKNLNEYPVFIPEYADEKTSEVLEAANSAGLDCSLGGISVGPTYTLIELNPTAGTRISEVRKLEEDISLSLPLLGVRVIAPVAGKGTIGIEIPNDKPQIISLGTLLNSSDFTESEAVLPIAVGMDVEGKGVVADLTKMHHLLIGGATGQGKSIFLNSLIVSLLASKEPGELKFMLIDPKMVEFTQYRTLVNSYLLRVEGIAEPIISNTEDTKVALNALCSEMGRRYSLLSNAGVRTIADYNDKVSVKLPYIVVVIDEFSDLIMTLGKDFETPIVRLAAMARAVGIHVVLATQRLSKCVVTGAIKANFPARVAFRVWQRVDSKTILDREGAQDLIGRGDMIFINNGYVKRLQGAFIDAPEIDGIVKSLSEHNDEQNYNLVIKGADVKESSMGPNQLSHDPLFNNAVKFLSSQEFASITLLHRKFGIGFNRVGKLMDELEAAGIVGPAQGAKPREILINPDGTHKPSKELLRDYTLEEIEAKLAAVPILARGFVMMQYRRHFEDKLYVKNLIDNYLDDEHPLRELIWNDIVNNQYNLDAYVNTILFSQSEDMAEKVAAVSPCLSCDKHTWSVVQECMHRYLKEEDFSTFDVIRPCSINWPQLTMSVPSNDIVNKLENEYHSTWSNILKLIFGTDVEAVYKFEA